MVGDEPSVLCRSLHCGSASCGNYHVIGSRTDPSEARGPIEEAEDGKVSLDLMLLAVSRV